MTKKIYDIVIQAMLLISQFNYDGVEKLSNGIRLNAEQIRDAIKEYGRTVLPFPQAELKLVDVIEVINSMPKKWSVVVPFWTQEEGRSDLSLELTCIDEEGNLRVEVDNIHVL
jgi:hypothetical protein